MKDQKKLLINCIVEDIPAIVITAKDALAVPVLEKYLQEAEKASCNTDFITDFKAVILGFKLYQHEEPQTVKKPD